MAYRRRRRRSRGTWLPNLGTVVEGRDPHTGIEVILSVPTSGDDIVGVVPLTFDTPQEPDEIPNDIGLNDLVGNEYFLHRIVGKIFAIFSNGFDGSGDISNFSPGVILTCGFFVARAQDAIIDSRVPIGGTAAYVSSYNPANPNALREPWIWRRQWILNNGNEQAFLRRTADNLSGGFSSQALAFPLSTAGYGSVADGPHVDAKTKRRVGNDDRVWFAMSAKNYPLNTTNTFGGSVLLNLDYRLFGSLRKARNRGTF